ncbi:MAG: hypothetical protein KGZ81_07460, partial [Flavobacteriales bacterium]|nr:hypothetical protein [Flavobacteriales bacterium]
MNAFYHVHAYVMTPSNTVRGTLLSDNIGATEFPTTSTGRTEGAKTLSAVSMQKGDRIVVEIGYRANNTVTTSYGVVIDRFATGADLTSGSTDVTLSPWVQFSANIMPVVSAGFYDNFPSSLDTAKWNDLSSNGGSAVVSGGQLVLNSGVADGEGIISSDHPYSLIGSSLSTYVSADVSVGTTVNHIFALRSYPTTSVAGQYIAWEITRSGSTRTLAAVSYNVAGTKTTHYSTTSIGTTYTGYLRIRESGGTIFWDSSPDNMTWTALASTASSGLAIRPEGMYPSLRTQSPSNITSYWDSINYSSSIENISDNFDDNSIDVAKWTAFNSPSEASNKLDITTTLGGIYRGLTSKLYYDLTSASVNVEVVSAGNQSLVSLEVYPLNLYQSGNTNSIFFLIAGGALIAYRRVNGVSTQLATTTYNSTNHRWLQIRESGGTTYWETSANGTSWSTLHSATNPIHVGQLLVEISAGTYAAEATTTTVTFDNLNVLPVTLTKTQPATAQIANDVTKTQPAIGHVATNPTKTQPAAAVIAGSGELTQTASAWIVETGDIQKTHLYKMFAGGQYLGLLPNVTSEFGFSQDMNTLGTQIAVEVGVSADTSNLAATDTLLEEDGDVLQTEDDEDLTTEGAVNLVGVGVSTETLIRNANRLEVWEYSKYHPNGKRMFIGTVERWEAEFGTGKEGIRLYAYSEGQDMNNYLVTGSPYVNDVSQTTQTANTVIQNNIGGTGTYSQFGQTWEVGASVTNLGAIDLMLDGQADVTVKVYSSVPTNPTSGTPIGVTTVAVDTTGPEVVQMAFSTPITTTPGATYFFAASVAS